MKPYKTLDEDLLACFKKRGLIVEELRYKKDTWTIVAKRKNDDKEE